MWTLEGTLTSHSLDLLNWSCKIMFDLVSYPVHTRCARVLTLLQRVQSAYCKVYGQNVIGKETMQIKHFTYVTRTTTVTLCRWSPKQTIPLSVLARNQTKGFGLEISAWPEVGREHQSEVGKGRRTDQSTPEQRVQLAWVSPGPEKEDRSRWVGIPSSVVEF